jgi:hypothetical protein
VWLRHRGIRSNDAFIVSYPRSGNTWLRLLLCEILTGEVAGFEIINRTIPDIGLHSHAQRLLPNGGRLIKSHEPFRDEYKKAVFLARDVRDVVVSEYYYLMMKQVYRGDLSGFVRQFARNKTNPFCGWADHADSWLDAQEHGRVELIRIKYEELLCDTEQQLARILTFLGFSPDRAAIMRAVENNSVGKVQKKEDAARETVFRNHRPDIRFVRKGKSGGWRDELEPADVRLIQDVMGETLARLGYSPADR